MSAIMLTFAEASKLARAIAEDFGVALTITPAGRDYIPTSIAHQRDGGIELFIPSRVRLDSVVFEMSLYLPWKLPEKYQHWQRTANGRRRPDSAIRKQCRNRALELARARAEGNA
jgi:hypothetical protein